MGRIFSYQEIQSGRVPEPNEFITARQHFADSLEAYIDESSIAGAFIYGSVAVNLANRRSDFDILLSTPRAIEGFEAAKNLADDVRIKTEGKIPISPIVQTIHDLKSGQHEMDRYFGEHLMSGDRVVFGEDPARIINFPDYPADEIIGTYLAQKKRRLINTYVSADPLDVREGGMQRMLELPAAVGRKALQALAETGHIESAVKKTADKRQVIRAIRKVLKPDGLAEDFDTLLTANNNYTRLLDETIEGKHNQHAYENELVEIHNTIPTAILWVQKLEEKLLPKLKEPLVELDK